MLKQEFSLTKITTATEEQTELTAKILAQAFVTDPLITWISPKPEIFTNLYFQLITEHLFIKRGITHIRSDYQGAAIWLPPEVSMLELPTWTRKSWEMIKHIISSGIKCTARSVVASTYLSVLHIKRPHYYLHAIGVLPEAQGQGVGSELLREVLKRCDAEKVPAYLENTNPHNLPLYERHGFRVMRELRMPLGAPPVWLMLREPLCI